MSENLFVGIDLSSQTYAAHFMDDSGNSLRQSLVFNNDIVGLHKLINTIEKLHTTHLFKSIHIGMEATGFYWWHLRQALDDKHFDAIDLKLYVINPSLSKGFKKAYTKLPKTDHIDAWIIADRIRFGRLKPITEKDLCYQPLARLTRFRFQMKKQIHAEKNRACNLVFLKFSSYAQAAGKRFFNKASLDLLNDFTLDEIAEKPVEELVEFFLEHGNKRFANPKLYAEEIKAAARRSYRLNDKMQDTVGVALAMSCQNLRFFESQCKKLDRVIAKELKAIPQTLTTITGVGPTLTAGIIAEIGDINRFNNEKGLAKFAGLTWNRHQSGSFEAEETSLTKAGNTYLRYYLVEAANCLRLHNADYRAFYQRKFDEVPKHQHKRALVLTARKFVRLVFAMLSKGQIYR